MRKRIHVQCSRPYIHSLIHPSVYPSIHQSIHKFVYSSTIHPLIHPFLHPSIHPFLRLRIKPEVTDLMGTCWRALSSSSMMSESTLSFSRSSRNFESLRNEKWSLYFARLKENTDDKQIRSFLHDNNLFSGTSKTLNPFIHSTLKSTNILCVHTHARTHTFLYKTSKRFHR